MTGASMQPALTRGQLSAVSAGLSLVPSPPHQVPMLAGASKASPLLTDQCRIATIFPSLESSDITTVLRIISITAVC
jgi:hypothetical protein